MEDRKSQKIFRRQPILCPWITSQPYHSSQLNKNKMTGQNDPTLTNRFLNNPWVKQVPAGINRVLVQDKSVPSIQQSSSQFFYFLRLMQLFPDTHPATLHTVLTLCKNDFFCAVDKLLYAKRCKILCYKRNLAQRLATSRNSNNKNSAGNETMTRNTVILRNGNHSEKAGDCSNITMNVSTSPSPEEGQSKDDLPYAPQVDDSSECTALPVEDGDTIIINLFPDKAEDLSILNKCQNNEELVL